METELNIDWTGIRHTDRAAVPTLHRQVRNVLAIEVERATIRNATVSGVFELSHAREPFSIRKGVQCAEVQCLWYARGLRKGWMHLKLVGKWTLVQKYTGPVVANISR